MNIKRVLIVVILLYSYCYASISSHIQLTGQETNWVAENHKVRVCVLNWPPYESNIQGLGGISVDIIRKIFNENKIDYELVSSGDLTWTELLEDIKLKKNFDLILTVQDLPERREYLNFTNPHLRLKSVIFTNKKSTHINSIEDLFGKTIYVAKNYGITNKIRKKYPQIKLHEIDNNRIDETCLSAVNSGVALAYIVDERVGLNFIQKLRLKDMRVLASKPFEYTGYSMGIRNDWPELASIINKSLKLIPDSEKNEILNEWITIKYDYGISIYQIFKIILLAVIVVIAVILVNYRWNRKLKKIIKEKDASETKFRTIFNNTPIPTAITTIDNLTYIAVNDGFTDILGFTNDDVIGKTPVELGIITNEQKYENISNLVKTESTKNTIKSSVYTKDKKLLQGIIYSEKIILDDKEYLITSFLDNSAEIEASIENQRSLNFANIVQKVTTKLINIDSNKYEAELVNMFSEVGKYLEANSIYIYEYDFDNKIVDNILEWYSSDYENLQGECVSLDLNKIPEIIKQHQMNEAVEFYDYQNSAPKYLRDLLNLQLIKSLVAVPIFNIESELIAFIGASFFNTKKDSFDRDKQVLQLLANIYLNTISKIRKEAELNKLNEELINKSKAANSFAMAARKANNVKTEFLAKMSHEIRTPINSMIGFTKFVLDTNIDDYQHKNLTLALESSEILLKIVNDILLLSKIESNQVELDYISSNIFEISREIVELFRLDSEKTGVSLYIDYDPSMPTYMTIDSLHFKQIVGNFLSNAFKFTKNGYVELRYTFIELDENKGELLVEVEDTGIGIREDEKDRIYKSFTQIDDTSTREYGGTGLGLSISNQLASMMGGQLSCESSIGKGSTFSLRIPVEYQKSEDTLKVKESKNILIHTDEQKSYDILKKHAEYNGYNVLPYTPHCENMNLKTIDNIHVLVINCNKSNLMCQNLFYDDLKANLKKFKLVIMYYSSLNKSVLEKKFESAFNQRFNKKPLLPYVFLKTIKENLALNDNKAINSSPRKIFRVLSNKKYSLLVVDDNKLNRKLLSKILVKYLPNARVNIAVNGQEAFEKTINDSYDIVFMDIQMPVMDGISSAKAIIKKLKSSAPTIVALTANTSDSNRLNAENSGMSDFVTKPINNNLLVEVLTKHLKIATDI